MMGKKIVIYDLCFEMRQGNDYVYRMIDQII